MVQDIYGVLTHLAHLGLRIVALLLVVLRELQGSVQHLVVD